MNILDKIVSHIQGSSIPDGKELLGVEFHILDFNTLSCFSCCSLLSGCDFCEHEKTC